MSEWQALYRDFNIDELADSMAQNGYFDEEPLVAIPKILPGNLIYEELSSENFENYIKQETTEFVVVEGNRRLATIKILFAYSGEIGQ
jgi:hypothetical protein